MQRARVPEDRARGGAEELALSYADRGVRSVSLRFPATVHGAGDHGFVPTLVGVARERGVSGYVGDGTNRWPAVHRLDAARLVRSALERSPAGSVVHAVAEEGVPALAIAAAISRGWASRSGPSTPTTPPRTSAGSACSSPPTRRPRACSPGRRWTGRRPAPASSTTWTRAPTSAADRRRRGRVDRRAGFAV